MKDPAILFYTSDFIAGTLTMTDAQRGKYIILLCLQHQKGYLTEKDMLNICKTYDEDIWIKFKEENGKFYNERMMIETEKRNKYSDSRRKNRMNTYDKHMITYDEHMGNININEDIIKDKIEKEAKIDFESFWNLYGKKVGSKDNCKKKWDKLSLDIQQKILDYLPGFLATIKDIQFQPYPETWLNQKRWENEIIETDRRVKDGYYEK